MIPALSAVLEALRRIGQIKRWPWGYSRGGAEIVEWMCHSCHGKFPDRGDENGQCPAASGFGCPSAVARAALAAWDARSPLREDEKLVAYVADHMIAGFGEDPKLCARVARYVLDCVSVNVLGRPRPVPAEPAACETCGGLGSVEGEDHGYYGSSVCHDCGGAGTTKAP